jgi:benzoate-CoA ligase
MALDIPSQFNLASYFLDRPAEEHPDRIAIAGEPRIVRYGELRELANQAGNVLLGLGCGPGNRVLIVLPDSPEFMGSFFGAAKIGSIAVPVNPMTRATDYAYYLADSGAQVAIVHALALGEFLAAAEKSDLRHIVVVGSRQESPSMPQTLRWDDCVPSASDDLRAYPSATTDSAFFLYTSGSGGRPKAAIHQHKDMLVTSQSFAQGVLGLRADDRTFSVSKLFFAYGLGNGMYFPFSVGATTILNPERPKA